VSDEDSGSEDVTLHLGGARPAPDRCSSCGREFQPVPGVTQPGLCLFCSTPAAVEDLIGE
jgi:hypothetical protein